MKRNSFIFCKSYQNAVQKLPRELRIKMYKAIVDYALDDIEPNLDLELQGIVETVRPQIDANNRKRR